MIKMTINSIVVVGLIAFFLSYFLEYSRPIPGNLTVFVATTQIPPQEFYSSPQAYELLNEGIPLARMPYEMAHNMNIPMAERSMDDFSCFHSVLAWWMIDNGMWPNYCRWNSRGEWQNSQWPRWMEIPLRSVGFF